MLCTSGKSVVIYVEGDGDRRLYQDLFDDRVALLPSHNYSNVEEVIRQYDDAIEKSKLPLILGIVDRDYRIACNQVASNYNLICTEMRDIECEIFNSVAFDNVVAEYSSAKLREKWPNIKDFKDLIIQYAAEIGKIRFYNHVKKSGIDFKKLSYQKIINLKSHQIIVESIIPHLSGAQKAGTIMPKKFDDVTKLVADKKYSRHLTNSLRLSRGHDFFAVMELYFTKGFGRSNAVANADTLESAIRIGFKPMLKTSPTVVKILAWFAKNNMLHLVK